MTERRDILSVAEIPTRTIHSGPRFEAALGDIDGALGTTQIGATLHVVPAGKTAWPFHRHHGNDEIFFVVAGEGTYRVGERRLPIKPGDLICVSAGGGFDETTNMGRSETRHIAFANHGRADVIDYPDSGKIAVAIAHGNDREPASVLDIEGYFTPSNGYWDGEDIGEDQ